MNAEISVTTSSNPKGDAESPRKEPERVREVRPAIDVLASGEELRVLADVPGVTPEELDVRLETWELRIEARRTCDEEIIHYRAALPVPRSIDPETMSAELRNGVLEVRMSRRESAKARRIEVRGAS